MRFPPARPRGGRAFDHYHPTAMVVFNIDLGHTDPQWVLPYGGTVTVDGPARRITAHYCDKTAE